MKEHAITTTDLTKKFKEVTAVDSLSFNVRRGEIFGFLGPNGAGKTTTIRMLCTLSRPTSGSAKVAGYDIVKEDGKVRENIGLVAEKLIMYDQLTARENLKLFGKLYDLSGPVLKKRTEDLLRLVRMERWGDQQIKNYSTGMKQRINVIRALLNRPNILFLDEPTLGLDPQSTNEIRELIKEINKEYGTSIILTTHMMIEADMLCDRVAIIDHGNIVALDTPDTLKSKISGTDTKVFKLRLAKVGSELIRSLKDQPSVKSVSLTKADQLKVQVRKEGGFYQMMDTIRKKGGTIRSVTDMEPTLEDVFLHITGRDVRDGTKRGKARDPHGPRWKRKSRVR